MSAGGEDSEIETSTDIDALLAELLPADADSDGGFAGWSVTSVGEQTPLPPEPAIERLPEVGPAPDRRLGVLPFVLAFAIIAGAVGYWFGLRQSSSDVATPGVADAAPDRGTAPTTTGSVIAATVDEATSSVSTTSEPPSPASVEVLEAQLSTFDLGRVGFVAGTDELTGEGQAAVADLAALLVANPWIPVALEASTFTEATADLNRALSSAQAEAIVSALVAEDVAPDRLVAFGLGSSLVREVGGNTALVFEASDAGLSADLSAVHLAAPALDGGDGLTTATEDGLDRVADALARHPGSTITLFGYAYADSPGASHDRSHLVLDQAIGYLDLKGVDGDRLRTVGMGDRSIDADLSTRLGVRVGPPAAISLALRELDTAAIAFEPGTDQLSPASLPALAEVANALALDETSHVEISAHTYSEATSDANHDLSHRQGDAVVAALIEAGVAGDRLSVVGRGDERRSTTSGEATVVFQVIG